MAKRIKIYFPNGDQEMEIFDDHLDKYIAKGFKKDKKEDRPLPKNDLEEEETNIIEE